MMLKRNRQRGFTLIELLIVVAIIGIIAAILIPNLIDALQKAKQKRTVSDLRNTGTSFMSWLTDQISASAAGGQPYDGTDLSIALDYTELSEFLNPAGDRTFYYMQAAPQIDGWKNDYNWFVGTNLLLGTVMCGQSLGRDGVLGPDVSGNCNTLIPATETGVFIATNYDHDIMWADGFFVMWPGGVGGN